MPRYHMHLISALRLLPLVFPAHGIRDSGVLCDGLGCEDVLEVAHVRPDGKRESLAQLAGQQLVHGVPRASGGPSAAGAPADETSSGIANEKLLKFWAVAIGLYAVLAVVSVGIWGGRGSEILKEGVEQLPDVAAIEADEALEESEWGTTLKFKDEALERMWSAHNKEKRIEVGTYTLFMLTIAIVMYQIARLWHVLDIDIACIKWSSIDVATDASKFGIFFIICALLGFNLLTIRRARKKGAAVDADAGKESDALLGQGIFWFALASYYFLIPAINMPPVAWSCQSLYDCKAYRTESWFLLQAVRHVDCTLSGPTALQMMITWLLIQPWVIPRYDMMHMCWLWVGFVYVGWSMTWNCVVAPTGVLDRAGIPMTDGPVFGNHDIFDRSMLLFATVLMSTVVTYYLEKSQRLQYLADRKQRDASKQMFVILEDMMPTHVIGRMMRGDQNIADHVERVSILFVLIADFDQKTKDLQSPAKVLEYLNEVFSKMDEICRRNRITKIETVGEEYVAAVGVVPSDIEEAREKGHGTILHRLLQASGEIMQTQTEDTRFKMGVHTGSIVAGVMQGKLPRFRLFGNTINTAARMMQKAPVGQLQFGEDTRQDVPADMAAQVTGPHEVEMKGKGRVQTYRFTPGRDFQTAASFTSQTGMSTNSLLGAVKALATTSKVVKVRDLMVANLQKRCASAVINNPASKLLDTEVDSRFRAAVGDTLDNDDEETPFVTGWHVMSEKKDFTLEMEEEWKQQHHEEHMGKTLGPRFGLESVLLLLVSCYELSCMFQDEVWKYDHPLYKGKWRDAVYVYCRGSVLFLTIAWWYVADTSRGQRWIREQRRSVAVCFVATYCLSAFLLYVSYDAFVCSDTKNYRKQTDFYEEGFKAPHDQIYMLNFLLIFFFMSQQHALLFWPSLSFVAVACTIAVLDPILNRYFGHAPVGGSTSERFEAPIGFLGKIMLIIQASLNTMASYTDEKQSRKRFKQQRAYSSTRDRTERILKTLMPEMVVHELSRNPEITPADTFLRATVAQSDLCGFTQLSSTKTPEQVVGFMMELFGMFDVLTDKYGVYKVETVGDAYIAGMAEKPLTKENSPILVVLFSLDMVREVDKWAKQQGGIGVTCRVGVAHGRCLGGIVGDTMQRYHLFGPLLTQMEILESTAPEGRVQVSQALKNEIDAQRADGALSAVELQENVKFELREGELRTSKGEVHTDDSVRGRPYVVDSDKPLRCAD